jgi:hypothetical protein
MSISATSKQRWVELSSAKVPANPAASVRVLLAALGNLRPQAGANPLVVVTARRVEGSGCKKRAEIAGFYEMKLAPGQACIGAAAVKAVLNAAAAQLCCDTLKCPKECPCEYLPQPNLAAYRCANGVEVGYLLQEKRVWNCVCAVPIET